MLQAPARDRTEFRRTRRRSRYSRTHGGLDRLRERACPTQQVLVRSHEIFRRKPDYREWLAVELDRLAQNFPIGTEPALPKVVAEHHNWGSRTRLFRSKSATHSGINSEHREVVL